MVVVFLVKNERVNEGFGSENSFLEKRTRDVDEDEEERSVSMALLFH